jgi:SAM-dependent methyltransferase
MSDPPQVDYDSLAAGYDERRAAADFSPIARAIVDFGVERGARRWLDLGCGTGHDLDGATVPPEALVYGFDLSAGMLAQARLRGSRDGLIRGTANALPFRGSFDLVFCVHAFHHFPDQRRVLAEIFAILRPGGAVAIVHVDPSESEWYVYDFFPEAKAIDLARQPGRAALEAMLRRAGYSDVSSPLIWDFDETIVGAAMLAHYFIRKESMSQFALLTDDQYAAGLARVREHAQRGGSFRTHLLNRMWRGIKR